MYQIFTVVLDFAVFTAVFDLVEILKRALTAGLKFEKIIFNILASKVASGKQITTYQHFIGGTFYGHDYCAAQSS